MIERVKICHISLLLFTVEIARPNKVCNLLLRQKQHIFTYNAVHNHMDCKKFVQSCFENIQTDKKNTYEYPCRVQMYLQQMQYKRALGKCNTLDDSHNLLFIWTVSSHLHEKYHSILQRHHLSFWNLHKKNRNEKQKMMECSLMHAWSFYCIISIFFICCWIIHSGCYFFSFVLL